MIVDINIKKVFYGDLYDDMCIVGILSVSFVII
jgi:hypothetical protein